MAVAYFLLLSSLGLAITTQAQDCAPPVGGENMNLKGDDIAAVTFPDGTRVTFACDVGYVSAGGSGSITCTAGTWSEVRLKCERRSCGSFPEVENGVFNYSQGILFGDILVISCKEGFNLVGKSQILCGAQGWEGRAPECEVLTCDQPPPVVNAIFSPIKEVYEYRDALQYKCVGDYTLVGSKSRTCSADGTFKPDPPTCTRVECPDLDIGNADWFEGSRPPHGYKSTVTYRCRAGYTLNATGTLTCEINSQWSPGIPGCIKTKTPTTTKATTTTTTTKDPSALPPITTVAHTTASTTSLSEPSPAPGGDATKIGLGVGLTALIGSVITCCLCYFCGVPACIKKKRSGGSYPDNVATKDGEDVALSLHVGHLPARLP